MSKQDTSFSMQSGDVEKTLDSCSEAIKLDENNVDALCDRAEGYILNEMYQEGNVACSIIVPKN